MRISWLRGLSGHANNNYPVDFVANNLAIALSSSR
jgi:hypothetical protein